MLRAFSDFLLPPGYNGNYFDYLQNHLLLPLFTCYVPARLLSLTSHGVACAQTPFTSCACWAPTYLSGHSFNFSSSTPLDSAGLGPRYVLPQHAGLPHHITHHTSVACSPSLASSLVQGPFLVPHHWNRHCYTVGTQQTLLNRISKWNCTSVPSLFGSEACISYAMPNGRTDLYSSTCDQTINHSFSEHWTFETQIERWLVTMLFYLAVNLSGYF